MILDESGKEIIEISENQMQQLREICFKCKMKMV